MKINQDDLQDLVLHLQDGVVVVKMMKKKIYILKKIDLEDEDIKTVKQDFMLQVKYLGSNKKWNTGRWYKRAK